MATYGSRGKKLFGNIAVKTSTADGFSSIVIGSGVAITPNSAIAASAITEITYTTGLASLSLATGDFVMVHPLTALASGLIIAGTRGTTNGIIFTWGNLSTASSTPSATNYDVFAFKRG